MRTSIVCFFCAACLPAAAATIRGIVIEDVSGRPLARSEVTLERLGEGGIAEARTQQTDLAGQFRFDSLPSGSYLVTARRRGFHPWRYGQKRPASSGYPVTIAGADDWYADIRLKRLAAISGRLLDENSVGLPDLQVLAYSSGPPMRIAGRAKADERGIYRIGELLPGEYVIRSAAGALEGGWSLLPTYTFRETDPHQAARTRVHLAEEAIEIDVQPLPGTLSQLSGSIARPCEAPVPAIVTLSGETGRESVDVQGCGGFQFRNLAPGRYQLLMATPNVEGDYAAASFRELWLDKDTDLGAIQLSPYPAATVAIDPRLGGPRLSDMQVKVRRLDMAGHGPETVVRDSRLPLAPGFWELQVTPPPGWTLRTMNGAERRPPGVLPDPDWYQLHIGERGFAYLGLVFDRGFGSVAGLVTATGDAAAAGAPVFLLPVLEIVRKRVPGIRQTRTGVDGRFRIEHLPPGEYLAASSFDLEEITAESMQEAGAVTVKAETGSTADIEIRLWNAP